MNQLSINELIALIRNYNKEAEPSVLKAYSYAHTLHENQTRQSGEPYIIHPLNVAYILAEQHADCDTLCAGLLHDTIEDTSFTKEDIITNFNIDVANLVDGVTKLSKMNFSSKEALNSANIRKLVKSIREDVRIITIKLADRLHNMRTLQFKPRNKQIETAKETLELYVPLAYYVGAYRIKSELEDLCLKYLEPDKYKEIEEKKLALESESEDCLKSMLYKIKNILNDKHIPNEIKIRTKNIYGIYKRLESGERLSDIHDILALKIMVDEVEDCYRTLYYVHSLYPPLNDKFKDYICSPKTNLYSSLHTTVFGPNERLVQAQIRTFEMDKIASLGLTAYWYMNKEDARIKMQEDLKNKFQFFKSLTEIDDMFKDNTEFKKQLELELLTNRIYVFTTQGNVIELPLGSTPVDFAYHLDPNIGNTMVDVVVNDSHVGLNYLLKNDDIVRIITNPLSLGPSSDWEGLAKTTYAKRLIKESYKKCPTQ